MLSGGTGRTVRTEHESSQGSANLHSRALMQASVFREIFRDRRDEMMIGSCDVALANGSVDVLDFERGVSPEEG